MDRAKFVRFLLRLSRPTEKKNNVKGSRTLLILGKASALCFDQNFNMVIKYSLTQIY